MEVVGSKKNVPDLGKAERGETITAAQCVVADGWADGSPLYL